MVVARDGNTVSRLDLILSLWTQMMTAEAELEVQIAAGVRDRWHQALELLSILVTQLQTGE